MFGFVEPNDNEYLKPELLTLCVKACCPANCEATCSTIQTQQTQMYFISVFPWLYMHCGLPSSFSLLGLTDQGHSPYFLIEKVKNQIKTANHNEL